ncbi:MAG: GTP-binding protein [Rhodospirillaceae bacterium]|jgi:flagellar biosynthesis protein FlhF|nr:GTP-binding protein [Rhodospirillaceae bacterium]
MRLKSYTAANMAEAMNLVRQELGEDAIIVSTQRSSDGQGVRITAALEAPDGDENITRALAGENTTPFSEGVREALTYHGVPARLIEKMVMTARSVEVGSPTMACAAALEGHFDFAPLPERKAPRPFMLVGPPGSGKTITVAKLAARARLAGRPVGVITIDTIRAGAVEQLTAFTKILEVEIHQVRGTDTLPHAVATMIENYDLVFIDSPGLNPFSHHDMNYLKALTHSADIEPILVLAAGGDAGEAADIGESFSACGATRVLATRLDMTRRLGSILAAADAGQLMFSEVSINPHVATGLCAINPVSMARMILPPDKDLQPAHFEDNKMPERPEGPRTEVS